ncbi:hypothetical protein NDU88_006914 [Pleurodeles waltl]|uniref:Uncharacterized protein n=1 Tax=Pleurodeles waltl TaxID=8319 RepID=A0AAV7QJA2_PLEWA|nr:hypothetical protein NDU88_006914 [Pleurodeles waltl]
MGVEGPSLGLGFALERPAMRETGSTFEALRGMSSSTPWPPQWFLGLAVPLSGRTSVPRSGRPAVLLKRSGECPAPPPGLFNGSGDLESLPAAAQASRDAGDRQCF